MVVAACAIARAGDDQAADAAVADLIVDDRPDARQLVADARD